MARCCGQALPTTRTQGLGSSCCPVRPTAATPGVCILRRSSVPDVSVAASTTGLTTGSLAVDPQSNQRQHHDISCRAVLIAERQVVVPTTSNVTEAASGQRTSASPKKLQVDSTDVAVIGADLAGLAAALAVSRAQPGTRVALYDTAAEPPLACDGGVLLSTNGLRALKALDENLYNRITKELASPVLEALWFDLEGELVRRTPLGVPSADVLGGLGSGNSRRRVPGRLVQGKAAARSGPSDPDPAAAPLMLSLHDLREALAEALPEDVEIFGRHHVSALEQCPSGGALLGFAASPSGSPVRTVRTKMLVGADGPKSVVKRLRFDQAPEQHQQPQPSGRIMWRGRFTLRKRDPDFARLRNFTTATRTWVDLRATHGSERIATLSPAGPNTFVWTANCPTSLMASRGLLDSSGASPYWRCLAMFEDFAQDFFASMRATAASAVVEYETCRSPAPATVASLAAPWQWFSGNAALVGDAVYSLPVDDASSTGVNLALEDAAVLGACAAQYGTTSRALQEYARLRASRVSALLALPPSAPERARLRDASFLPVRQLAAQPQLPQQQAAEAAGAADASTVSLASTVAAGVDSAAAAAAAVPHPAQPLEELLAKAAAATAAISSSPLGTPTFSPGRPSGGASRTAPGAPAAAPALSKPSGPSSPLFSRPSGARRLGPVPAAIAAVIGILAAAPCGGGKAALPQSESVVTSTSVGSATAAVPASAAKAVESPSLPVAASEPMVDAPADSASASSNGTAAADSAALQPPYSADSTPHSVWGALLRTHGSIPEDDATTISNPSVEDAGSKAREYCSPGTPLAVWQALLVAPAKAHDILVSLPYNPAESPVLAWMALLGTLGAADAATGSAASAAGSSTADSPCSLLPRPVLKQKQPHAAAVSEVHPSSDTCAAEALSMSAPRPAAGATVSTTALSPAPDQPRRRRPRSQAGPISGRWAGNEQRVSGKARGGPPRAAAGTDATAVETSAAGALASSAATAASHRSKAKARAKAVAAKAAATMTMSLSAAAALGGVIGAGTGHMPVDVAAALHAHGTVAQFWEELNNLTLSSASLSSIDLS